MNSIEQAQKLLNQLVNIPDLPEDIHKDIEQLELRVAMLMVPKKNPNIRYEAYEAYDVLTVFDIREILEGVSNTFWNIELDERAKPDMSFFNTVLGLSVQESDIVKITARRIGTVKDSDIDFLIFTCMPGQVFVGLQTPDYGYNSDIPIDNNDLSWYLMMEHV